MLKKGDSVLDPSLKKEKELVNIYDFDYTIILILCRATVQKNTYFCKTASAMRNLTALKIVGFFSYFFCFFKYAQKNSPMHEKSPIVVAVVVLKWKIFDFKSTITTTIKQQY